MARSGHVGLPGARQNKPHSGLILGEAAGSDGAKLTSTSSNDVFGHDAVARFGYVIRCPRPLTHLPDSSGHRLHSEQGGELILISNSPGRLIRVSADRAANVRSHWHPIYSDEHVGLHDLPKKAG